MHDKLIQCRQQNLEKISVRQQNEEFKDIILKYEEQSQARDSELQAVQVAIKESVANVEEANQDLQGELSQVRASNQELVRVNG